MKASDRAIVARGLRIDVTLSGLSRPALLVDGEGCIIGANASARRMFHYGRRQLDRRPITELIPDLTLTDIHAAQAATGRLKRREMAGRRLDGSQFSVLVALVRVAANGEPALLLSVSDLTRRKALLTAVRDSRYGFRQLARSFPQMLWTCRPDGTADYFSPQWTRFTGATLESQLGSGWLEQVHPEDRPAVEAQWRDAITSTRTFTAQFRVRRHDGQYRWFASTVVPVSDRSGGIMRWMGANDEIHEAREMQQALIEERDRFSKLVASVPGAIYAFRLSRDGSTSFPLASAGIRDLYGLSAEELAHDASPVATRIHPDDIPHLTASLVKSAQTLTPWHSEWRVLNPEKGERWAEGRSVPTREPDGGTLFYGLIMDVTERKHAEQELRRSQARLQAAIKAGGIGTWIWDIAGDRVWWDEAMFALWGREPEVEPMRGDSVSLFLHEDDRGPAYDSLRSFIRSRAEDFSVEFRVQRDDGIVQWIAVTGRAERNAKGRVVRMIGACMDVTTRKRIEESQRHSQKIEALGTLAGGIAHDFNNILLAITGNAKLAMADLPYDHPVQRGLAEIDKASVRASDLVHRILAFSRQTEPKREIVQLRPTIEEALKLLRATLPAMIEIKASFAAEVPAVHADSTQIHQIIMNLITNGAHAIGEEPGSVGVRLDTVIVGPQAHDASGLKPGKYAHLAVTDSGCGMDAAILERIFDPFFTTKPAGQGTGLGLSVVHGIVRSHDGTITVDSEPGRGTTFHLYFPAAAVAQAESQEAPARSSMAAVGQGQRVLYIDDEDTLVYLASRLLKRLGYQVSGYTDPGKALQAFLSAPHSFDVIVTDISMPGMSGFHLARAILEARPDIPVLMTSGYVRPEDRETAEKLGARDLIPKPDTLEELGHALQRVFASTP